MINEYDLQIDPSNKFRLCNIPIFITRIVFDSTINLQYRI